MDIVTIEHLKKTYNGVPAVDGLDLSIREGEIFGLLGPNGSGKTTTINCLLALLKYDSGSIRVFGHEMTPSSYDLKRKIGVVFQDVAVFAQMTVQENIDYFCSLYVPDKKERARLVEEAIMFTGLEEQRKKRPKQLSGGLLRRLNIACGIAHKPQLIILDEPTVAVDPQSRNRILEAIVELNRMGSTIIYTSHYMEEVEQICSRIAIMDKGRSIASGTAEELKSQVRAAETVTVEEVELTEEQLNDLKELPKVCGISYEDRVLKLRSTGERNNIVPVLHYLEARHLSFGRVFSEQPTLNDVFLEITGTELRD